MKKHLHLKIFAFIFSLLIAMPYAKSQILVEDFNYTIGTLLTDNGWTGHSGTGTNNIAVTAPTLTYPGYLSSGIGNEVSLTTTGQDVNLSFPAQTAGTVYTSFLVRIDSATTTGDYFFHLGQTTVGSAFRARLFVKRNASNQLAFGIAQSSTTGSANYSGFDYSLNTTYLIVVKYELITGTTNDVSSFIVNPPLNSPIPTTGWITNTDASGADLTELGSVALRQGTAANAPMLKLDGIRVSTDWAHIVGSLTTPVLTVNPTTIHGFYYQLGSGPTNDESFVISGSNLSSNVVIAAPPNYEITLTSGANYTDTIILTPASGVLPSTNIFVRLKANLPVGGYFETIGISIGTNVYPYYMGVSLQGGVEPIGPAIFFNGNSFFVSTPNFTYVHGSGPSAEYSFSVNGYNINTAISIWNLTNFEVSLTSGTGFVDSLPILPINGIVNPTTVYLRMKAGLSVGNYGDSIKVTSGSILRDIGAGGIVTPASPSAAIISRPSHIDISSITSESAVLVQLSNYPVDSVKYRLFNGSNQYYPWDEETKAYVTSTSYANGPLAIGTPTSSSTFWIVFERGSNATTVASYRDRVTPFSSNFQTAVLPTATEIIAPFSLTGTFVGNAIYDNLTKRVVLAYSGTNLISAASTDTVTGLFDVVCPVGDTITKIEIRTFDNILIDEKLGSWYASSNTGLYYGLGNASLSSNLETFIINLPAPITTNINWNAASSVTSIVDNQTTPYTLTASDYSVVGNILTINPSYLSAVLPNANMSIALQVNFNMGSSSTLTIHSISTVDINENENIFLIYPNPSNGQFSIIANDTYMMSIYDISGRLIQAKEIYNGTNEISMINNARGIYTVKITNSKLSKSYRIVIQ